MASASTTAAKSKAPPVAKAKKQTAASKEKAKPARVVTAKPRLLFIPGSLNDQISKLGVDESMAHVLRIPMVAGDGGQNISRRTRAFFNSKNSVLSGGIAKVRSAAEHKDKRFTMERGSYMTVSNDAMFAFLTITRTE